MTQVLDFGGRVTSSPLMRKLGQPLLPVRRRRILAAARTSPERIASATPLNLRGGPGYRVRQGPISLAYWRTTRYTAAPAAPDGTACGSRRSGRSTAVPRPARAQRPESTGAASGGGPTHRHVIFLHGGAWNRIDRGRHGVTLHFGDDAGSGVLGDHETRVHARVTSQERRQAAVARHVKGSGRYDARR